MLPQELLHANRIGVQSRRSDPNRTPPIPVDIGPFGYPECLGNSTADAAHAARPASAGPPAAAPPSDPAACPESLGAYRSDRDRLIDGEWGPGVVDAIDVMGVLMERAAGVLGRAAR